MVKGSNRRRFNPSIDMKDDNSRNIVLSSDIDSTTVGDIIEIIMDINTFDDELEESLQNYQREPIKLVVNSFGGSVYDGFALIAAIEHSKTPIHGYSTVLLCPWVLSFILQPMSGLHIKRQHSCTMRYQTISGEILRKLSKTLRNVKGYKRYMMTTF